MAVADLIQPFVWGEGGAKMTPEQIAREREIAEALGVVDTSPVGHWTQGAARVVNALGGVLKERRADQAEQENLQYDEGLRKKALAAFSSGSPVAAALAGETPQGQYANDRVAQAFGDPGAPQVAELSGSKEEFINALMPAALEASQRTGVDPRIIVAQAAQETGWGKSAPGNNFFGIKSHGKGGGQNLTTHEVINGQRVRVNDSFRQFASPADSVAGYADFLLENPRYKPMMSAQGLDAQLEALGASGYATDPNYASSVGSIARSIPMPQGGQSPQAAAIGQPVQMAQAQPQTMNDAGGINPAIIQALSDPRASSATRQIAGLLLGQQMEQQAAANDPMRAIELEIAQEKLNQMRNPTPEQTAEMQNLSWRAQQAGLQPGTPEYTDFMLSGGKGPGTVVNVGNGAPELGKLSADYGYVLDPETRQPVIDPATGLPTAAPVPGSPAALELEAAARAEQNREEGRTQRSDLITQEIDRVLNTMETGILPDTGAGAWLSGIPGTDAKAVSSLLDTIKANIGFEELNRMRQQSPTGGALGQVTERELAFLQSVAGSLDQSQSPSQLRDNLNRLWNAYMGVIHGDGNFDKRPLSFEQGDQRKPISELSDEELEAIINGQ